MAFKDWKKLCYGIQRGECILFLGPELPMDAGNGEKEIPLHRLSERLIDRLREMGKDVGGLNPGDLPPIAQRFVAAEDEFELELQLSNWHEELREAKSLLHDNLASLPFRRILTTGLDPLMETALERAERQPAVGLYHYRGGTVDLLSEREPTLQSPQLYYLYGKIGRPKSLLLTENHLFEYLTALISKAPPLPKDVAGALTEGRQFLFLGFGLTRWYLRLLLHVLRVLKKRGRSFAIECSEPPEEAVLFYRDFKLDIHCQDVCEFVQEMRARCPAWEDGTVAASAPMAGQESPKVFVCHASEDHHKARQVHEALAAANAKPWLDRESLLGGDRWDELIESVIPEMDYFVVLNSRALASKTRKDSYVNKEINVARKRVDWRMGNYIIPARIDEEPLLDLFKGIHDVDLTQPNGLRDLIRAIKRREARA